MTVSIEYGKFYLTQTEKGRVMIIQIELENDLTANKDGKAELQRIFDHLINRLGPYWDEPLQADEKWSDTTLIIYSLSLEKIGKFYASARKYFSSIVANP